MVLLWADADPPAASPNRPSEVVSRTVAIAEFAPPEAAGADGSTKRVSRRDSAPAFDDRASGRDL